MMKYEKIILKVLINKYENSKSFIGENKNNQSFSVKPEGLFPKYSDEAEYDYFMEVNEAVDELEKRGLVTVLREKSGVVKKLTLNMGMLAECYSYLSIMPKKEIHNQLISLFNQYCDKNELLSVFCKEQKNRIANNKKVDYFNNDMEEYENILKAVANVYNVTEETYIRDFSIRIFHDSKTFGNIKDKVAGLLFKYGDFPCEDSVLEDLNIVKNPGHVYIKGCGAVSIDGQFIDLSKLNGDIAVSSAILDSIDKIDVTGCKVVTIENLTTFNCFAEKDAFAVYLGGYHNSHRRKFIRRMYEQNPDIEYYHYGDIDAGGFYILIHLREKTGIDFIPYHMDIQTLQKYALFTKSLTENDRKRLKKLSDSEFEEIINYMLKNNCKLEQEALDME